MPESADENFWHVRYSSDSPMASQEKIGPHSALYTLTKTKQNFNLTPKSVVQLKYRAKFGPKWYMNVQLKMRICKRGSTFGIFAQSKWTLCEHKRSEQENWALTTWIQYNRCDSHHIVSCMNYWRCRVEEYSDFRWKKNVWLIPLLI